MSGILHTIEGEDLANDVMKGAPRDPARMKFLPLPVFNAENLPAEVQALALEGGGAQGNQGLQQQVPQNQNVKLLAIERQGQKFLLFMRDWAPVAIIALGAIGDGGGQVVNAPEGPQDPLLPPPNRDDELFRGMHLKNGRPRVGTGKSASELMPRTEKLPPGVQPADFGGYTGPTPDIKVNPLGEVEYGGGISAGRGTAREMLPHQLPKGFDSINGPGTKDPNKFGLFAIKESDLPEGLQFIPDGGGKAHGVIGPNREGMMISEYMFLLNETIDKWIQENPPAK